MTQSDSYFGVKRVHRQLCYKCDLHRKQSLILIRAARQQSGQRRQDAAAYFAEADAEIFTFSPAGDR